MGADVAVMGDQAEEKQELERTLAMPRRVSYGLHAFATLVGVALVACTAFLPRPEDNWPDSQSIRSTEVYFVGADPTALAVAMFIAPFIGFLAYWLLIDFLQAPKSPVIALLIFAVFDGVVMCSVTAGSTLGVFVFTSLIAAFALVVIYGCVGQRFRIGVLITLIAGHAILYFALEQFGISVSQKF